MRLTRTLAVLSSLGIALAIFAGPGYPTQPRENPTASPSLTVPAGGSVLPSGFTPPGVTMFMPILELASPGPERATRATEFLDRQAAFQLATLHPVFSEDFERILDKIPHRSATLIRAAWYYSRTDIPWIQLADGTHEIAIAGRPSGPNYFLAPTPEYESPTQPFQVSGYLALKPPPGYSPNERPGSVIGSLGGELETDTFGFDALVDVAGAMLREIYGDLKPPWDTAPGIYNHHDRAAQERFRRELPTVDELLHYYLRFDNILDEFETPNGPCVLYNFNGAVKPESLARYAFLHRFYAKVASALSGELVVINDHHNYWLKTGFDHGRVWVTFMVRDGKLVPFDSDYRPAGEPIALGRIERGVNRSIARFHITRLGMDFGLDNLSFTNRYTRTSDSLVSESRMDSVPEVVAPPGLKQVALIVARRFIRTLAQGSGGLRARSESHRASDGKVHLAAGVRAEFRYSPALELLARIADSVAEANDDKVRADERALAEELFRAFLKDYNNVRPRILALDKDPGVAK